MDYIVVTPVVVGVAGVFLTIWSIFLTRQNNELAKLNTELSEQNTQMAKQNAETAKLNLLLAEDNRRNALREHLFKEQILFFKEMMRQIVAIGVLFDDVQIDKEISEECDNKIEKAIDELNAFFDSNVLIIPNTEIYDRISFVISEADELYFLLIRQEGKATDEEYDRFFDAFYIATDTIREFYGIEELSKETLEITRSKRKAVNH